MKYVHRLLSLVAIGLLCTGCWPLRITSSPGATGVLLDAQTHSPVSGAEAVISRRLRSYVETPTFQAALTNTRPPLVISGNSQVFGNDIDYATEQKIFGTQKPFSAVGFYPLRLTGIKKRRCIGNPYMKLATTSHCELTNLSVRLFTRWFTRCTLVYSKTLYNLRHAVARFVAHFNFCRVHSALGMTPAQAAGLTDHTWTIEEMLAGKN